MKEGNFPDFVQSNLPVSSSSAQCEDMEVRKMDKPESTMAPAIVVPWPPIHFVALWTDSTSSNPHSNKVITSTDQRYRHRGQLDGQGSLQDRMCYLQSRGYHYRGRPRAIFQRNTELKEEGIQTLDNAGRSATMYPGLPILST